MSLILSAKEWMDLWLEPSIQTQILPSLFSPPKINASQQYDIAVKEEKTK